MNRQEICQELNRLGIFYSKFTLKKNLEKLLPVNTVVQVEGEPEKVKLKRGRKPKIIGTTKSETPKEDNSQLIELISTLANNVKSLSQEMGELRTEQVKLASELQEKSAKTDAVSAPVTVSGFNMVPPTEELFPRIPRDLERVALEVLGDKFRFECEPMVDQPAFMFTVIVPPEYTTLKDEIDRRSKVIPSSLGANGVKEWCLLVKQNIVKHLGAQINIKA